MPVVPRAVLIPTLALMLVAPFGAADHGCNGTVTTLDAGIETLYIDDRSQGPGDIEHFVYLESNGIKGLQSGNDWSLSDGFPFSFVDGCRHPNPDTLVI